MISHQHIIGISCIGSGVGQSVITSCRLSGLPLRTVGLGTNPFAYGMYECDAYDLTPTIYAASYVDELLDTCRKHRIDLLIPGLDDEALLLSKHVDRFEAEGIGVVVSGTPLVETCRDKRLMSARLNAIDPVFVRSYDREEFLCAAEAGRVEYPVIAKPRSGCASRGIGIIGSKDDLSKIRPEQIVQELAIPGPDDPNHESYLRELGKNINHQISEISIQLVAGRDGALLGRMATFNKLNNGVPIEIVSYENPVVWEHMDRLHPEFQRLGLRGPLNLQGRMTEHGLRLYEMNARFTGITGLRAMMGFNEVEACIRAWLAPGLTHRALGYNRNTFGTRQTTDKVIQLSRSPEVRELSRSVNGPTSASRKNVLVTGSTGFLGRALLSELRDNQEYEVWTLDRDRKKAEDCHAGSGSAYYDYESLADGSLALGRVDVLVHCAFARPHLPEDQIAASLSLTQEIFTRAAMHNVEAIVNISSQGVYGKNPDLPWKEGLPPSPSTAYGQAKYSSELCLRNLNFVFPHVRHTSLRMCALSGVQPGLVPVDLISKLARTALQGSDITIVGGGQEMERLDIRDAARAIVALLGIPNVAWKDVYNIAPGETYNIKELGRITLELAAAIQDIPPRALLLKEGDVTMAFGMDASRMRTDTGWAPRYSIRDTIESVVRHLHTNPIDFPKDAAGPGKQ